MTTPAQSIDSLDLFHLPVETQAFADDPTPFLAAARARHPWLAMSVIGPVLTSYRAIDEIMRMDDALAMPGSEIVGIMGAQGTGWGDFAQRGRRRQWMAGPAQDDAAIVEQHLPAQLRDRLRAAVGTDVEIDRAVAQAFF
ncbi:MAG TPA: hypothetical protein VMQ93_03420, partial [Novosphingobium sp.]|nr:hypothetical protein [Novosphingobium sp.]